VDAEKTRLELTEKLNKIVSSGSLVLTGAQGHKMTVTQVDTDVVGSNGGTETDDNKLTVSLELEKPMTNDVKELQSLRTQLASLLNVDQNKLRELKIANNEISFKVEAQPDDSALLGSVSARLSELASKSALNIHSANGTGFTLLGYSSTRGSATAETKNLLGPASGEIELATQSVIVLRPEDKPSVRQQIANILGVSQSEITNVQANGKSLKIVFSPQDGNAATVEKALKKLTDLTSHNQLSITIGGVRHSIGELDNVTTGGMNANNTAIVSIDLGSLVPGNVKGKKELKTAIANKINAKPDIIRTIELQGKKAVVVLATKNMSSSEKQQLEKHIVDIAMSKDKTIQTASGATMSIVDIGVTGLETGQDLQRVRVEVELSGIVIPTMALKQNVKNQMAEIIGFKPVEIQSVDITNSGKSIVTVVKPSGATQALASSVPARLKALVITTAAGERIHVVDVDVLKIAIERNANATAIATLMMETSDMMKATLANRKHIRAEVSSMLHVLPEIVQAVTIKGKKIYVQFNTVPSEAMKIEEAVESLTQKGNLRITNAQGSAMKVVGHDTSVTSQSILTILEPARVELDLSQYVNGSALSVMEMEKLKTKMAELLGINVDSIRRFEIRGNRAVIMLKQSAGVETKLVKLRSRLSQLESSGQLVIRVGTRTIDLTNFGVSEARARTEYGALKASLRFTIKGTLSSSNATVDHVQAGVLRLLGLPATAVIEAAITGNMIQMKFKPEAGTLFALKTKVQDLFNAGKFRIRATNRTDIEVISFVVIGESESYRGRDDQTETTIVFSLGSNVTETSFSNLNNQLARLLEIDILSVEMVAAKGRSITVLFRHTFGSIGTPQEFKLLLEEAYKRGDLFFTNSQNSKIFVYSLQIYQNHIKIHYATKVIIKVDKIVTLDKNVIDRIRMSVAKALNLSSNVSIEVQSKSGTEIAIRIEARDKALVAKLGKELIQKVQSGAFKVRLTTGESISSKEVTDNGSVTISTGETKIDNNLGSTYTGGSIVIQSGGSGPGAAGGKNSTVKTTLTFTLTPGPSNSAGNLKLFATKIAELLGLKDHSAVENTVINGKKLVFNITQPHQEAYSLDTYKSKLSGLAKQAKLVFVDTAGKRFRVSNLNLQQLTTHYGYSSDVVFVLGQTINSSAYSNKQIRQSILEALKLTDSGGDSNRLVEVSKITDSEITVRFESATRAVIQKVIKVIMEGVQGQTLVLNLAGHKIPVRTVRNLHSNPTGRSAKAVQYHGTSQSKSQNLLTTTIVFSLMDALSLSAEELKYLKGQLANKLMIPQEAVHSLEVHNKSMRIVFAQSPEYARSVVKTQSLIQKLSAQGELHLSLLDGEIISFHKADIHQSMSKTVYSTEVTLKLSQSVDITEDELHDLVKQLTMQLGLEMDEVANVTLSGGDHLQLLIKLPNQTSVDALTAKLKSHVTNERLYVMIGGKSIQLSEPKNRRSKRDGANGHFKLELGTDLSNSSAEIANIRSQLAAVLGLKITRVHVRNENGRSLVVSVRLNGASPVTVEYLESILDQMTDKGTLAFTTLGKARVTVIKSYMLGSESTYTCPRVATERYSYTLCQEGKCNRYCFWKARKYRRRLTGAKCQIQTAGDSVGYCNCSFCADDNGTIIGKKKPKRF
jgi:antitoxin component of MazEF toxin-antitoxin module